MTLPVTKIFVGLVAAAPPAPVVESSLTTPSYAIVRYTVSTIHVEETTTGTVTTSTVISAVPLVGGITGDASFSLDLVGGSGNVAGAAADIDLMEIRKIGDTGAWTTITVDLPFTLSIGSSGFDVRIRTVSDLLVEGNENFQVVAKQTGPSAFIAGSYWVPATVVIADGADGAIASITADNPTGLSGDEAGMALASFTLSSALTLPQSIHVGIQNLGGASAQDYSNFSYNFTDGTGALQSVINDMITIPAGVTHFTLAAYLTPDSLANETGESITFTVSEDASNINLVNSWWVTSNVLINDMTPAAAAPSRIFAGQAVLPGVDEGAVATTDFRLTGLLPDDATVRISIQANGADSSDYGNFQYKTGTAFVDVPSDGIITIPAGTAAFFVRANISSDLIYPEPAESIVFVASQVSGNLADSWWVTSQVGINDVAPTADAGSAGSTSSPTSAPSISASPLNPQTVNEGSTAAVTFNLSHALTTNVLVNVGLEGWGATADLDYENLQYVVHNASPDLAPLSVRSDGRLILHAGTTGFDLLSNILTDTVHGETNESINFTVRQDSTNDLTDSYWVTSLVGINDVPAPGFIADDAKATITADGSILPFVAEGNLATAGFALAALTNAASVRVAVSGNGTDASDYGPLMYRIDSGSAPTFVPVGESGLIVIPAGTTHFSLQSAINTDQIFPEPGESIGFVVSQESENLTNSWWVTSQVGITDVAPPSGAAAGSVTGIGGTPVSPESPASISRSTANPSSINEGAIAVVTFNLSHALTTDTIVNVGLQGWGATAGLDYANLQYVMHNASPDLAPLSVGSDGKLIISAGTTAFDLLTNILTDTVYGETYESIMFTVSQDSVNNLTDSYWVTALVGINDVALSNIDEIPSLIR